MGFPLCRAWILRGALVLVAALYGGLAACSAGPDASATLGAPPPIARVTAASSSFPTPSLEPAMSSPQATATRIPVDSATDVATSTMPPAPTLDVPTPIPATETPAAEDENRIAVAYVASNDTLNVRSGPGVQHTVVAELAPDASELRVLDVGQEVEGSAWVPISSATGEPLGWVNSRYLTGAMSPAEFCSDPAVLALLEALETAVATQDNALLASLVHPQRGLRIHTSWWNPSILPERAETQELFDSDRVYLWGVEDGSGLPIQGDFGDVILPELRQDLLGAEERTCNEIKHGGTAGLVQLPEGYQPIHFFSYYRPAASEELPFDWGTWVAGIERWQSRYYLAYLVHYQWEI